MELAYEKKREIFPTYYLSSTYKNVKKQIIFGYSLTDFSPKFTILNEKRNKYLELTGSEMLVFTGINSGSDDGADKQNSEHVYLNPTLTLKVRKTVRKGVKRMVLESLETGVRLTYDLQDLENLHGLRPLIAHKYYVMLANSTGIKSYHDEYKKRYEENQYLDIPNFIPNDAAIHIDYGTLYYEIKHFYYETTISTLNDGFFEKLFDVKIPTGIL